MTDRIRVLITNDDGVGSAGIRWLVRAAAEHGLDACQGTPPQCQSQPSARTACL